MDVEHWAEQHGGVIRWRELRDAGVSSGGIVDLVARGVLCTAGHGVYHLPDADPELIAIRLAGGRLTCVSRAKALGLWTRTMPVQRHIGVLRGHALAGCVVHRVVRRQSIIELLRQCCRCLPELDALVIVESAVVQRRVRWDELRHAVAHARSGRERRVVDLVDPTSESALETVGRYRLRMAGHHVQSQVFVIGAGRIDALVDGVLFVEFDGAEFHSDRRSYREDRRRWNSLTVQDRPLLRVSYELVMHEPATFVRLVRDAVEQHRRVAPPRVEHRPATGQWRSAAEPPAGVAVVRRSVSG